MEQLRKLARELHRAQHAGQREALARIRGHHSRAGDAFRLEDAVYHSSPLGWAQHSGHDEVERMLGEALR
jgi:hypothetical protein